jgi:hypothetical protein
MTALDEFIKVNGRIKDPSKDQSWLSDTEVVSLTNEQGNFDKNLYRMLLFRAVSDAFKNGTLVLKESYQYRPFEHYLLDKRLQVPYWAQNYIAPCKYLIVRNLHGVFLRYIFIFPRPYFINIKS